MDFIKKITIKRIAKILIFVIVFAIALLYVLDKYNKFMYKKIAEKIDYEVRKPYLEDRYGGKTPEETLQMFFDALRKGDVDLASKYFYLNYQEKYKRYLSRLKENNGLQETINLWEERVKNGKKYQDEDGFSITWEAVEEKNFIATDMETGEQIEMPAGVYLEGISLEKNENGIWKITNL